MVAHGCQLGTHRLRPGLTFERYMRGDADRGAVSRKMRKSSGIFVILLLSREGDARMDARPKTRQVDRERKTPSTPVPRGAKPIVIPMTQQQYDDLWHDADRFFRFKVRGLGFLTVLS